MLENKVVEGKKLDEKIEDFWLEERSQCLTFIQKTTHIRPGPPNIIAVLLERSVVSRIASVRTLFIGCYLGYEK